MAPDSRFCRHRLGEATPKHRRFSPHATIPLLLLLIVCTTSIEARTESIGDTWSELSPGFLAHERSLQGSPLMLSSLPPTPKFYHASPAGQSENGIQIHIPINHPSIQRYIDYYEGRGRVTLMTALERSLPYISIMAEVLEAHKVPAEMVYVALVESCFKGKASYRGAGGYWQLLGSTARKMGLRVDRLVDERRDPIKSTQAAAKYLRSSYEQYGSWPLALAAYNAGGGPVLGALSRSAKNDSLELLNRGGLPGRTKVYVAKVLAAIQVMRNLENQGFKRPRHSPIFDFESIVVESPLKLEQVAGWLEMPVKELRDLNPSLLTDRVPTGDSGFVLRLPSGARDKFDLAYSGYTAK